MDEDLCVGGLADVYVGRRRKTTSRQIGFLSKELGMPKVGGKKFPYDKAGRAAAKEAAKKLPSRKALNRKMKEAK